jgi:hypothetical protein
VNQIVAEIVKEFTQIKPGSTELEIKSSVRSILRLINKAQVVSGKKSVGLAKIGTDLQSLVDTQIAFNKMNRDTVVEKFDDSFFRALEILKKDLFTLLR